MAENELVFDVPAVIYSSATELAGAMEELSTLEGMLVDALEGKMPPPSGPHWQAVVGLLKTRTAEISAFNILTTIDGHGYEVSLNDLEYCHLRRGAISRMEDYLTELRDLQLKGESAEVLFVKIASTLDGIVQSLEVSIAINEKLVASGISVVVWNWWDLSQHVLPAVRELSRKVSEKRRDIVSSLDLIRVKVSNFSGNLADIRSSEYCSLARDWVGSLVVEDVTADFGISFLSEHDLEYRSNGILNKNPCEIVIDAAAGSVHFRPFCGSSLRFDLEIDPSYTSMSGVLSDDDDSFAVFPISLGIK